METIKIKVKGVRYGRTETIIHKWKTDKVFQDETFDEIPTEIKDGKVLKKIKLPFAHTINRNSKIIDHLDDIQFGGLMMDLYGFDCIMDYYVHEPKKSTKATVMEILAQLEMDAQAVADFAHTYDSMKDSIKGMTPAKQVKIVMGAMSVAYQSGANAWTQAGAMIQGIWTGKDDDSKLNKLREHKEKTDTDPKKLSDKN